MKFTLKSMSVGILALCVLLTGCGKGDDGVVASSGTTSDAAQPSTSVVPTTERAFLETQLSTFDGLPQMADRSDVVALMSVEDIRDGQVIDTDHAGTSTQILAELVVESAVKGAHDGETIPVWIGIRETDSDSGNASDRFTTRGYTPTVGDKLVAGLIADSRSPGTYGVESNDSFFVLDNSGDRFRQDISTSNEQARAVRSRPVDDVLTELRAR